MKKNYYTFSDADHNRMYAIQQEMRDDQRERFLRHVAGGVDVNHCSCDMCKAHRERLDAKWKLEAEMDLASKQRAKRQEQIRWQKNAERQQSDEYWFSFFCYLISFFLVVGFAYAWAAHALPTIEIILADWLEAARRF